MGLTLRWAVNDLIECISPNNHTITLDYHVHLLSGPISPPCLLLHCPLDPIGKVVQIRRKFWFKEHDKPRPSPWSH